MVMICQISMHCDYVSFNHAVAWKVASPFKSVAGKTFPAFPAHAQPAIVRIWLEAHYFKSKRKRGVVAFV